MHKAGLQEQTYSTDTHYSHYSNDELHEDVFLSGAYLWVTVREDQFVIDCHRFPLC